MEKKLIVCDRCNKELVTNPRDEIVMYKGSVRIDLCVECYKEFFEWFTFKPKIEELPFKTCDPDAYVRKADEEERKEVSDLVHPLWNLNKNLQDSKERNKRAAFILKKYGFNIEWTGSYNSYVIKAEKYRWAGKDSDHGWKGVPIYYVTGDVITDPEYLTQKCDEFKEILDAHIKAGRIVKNEESTDE